MSLLEQGIIRIHAVGGINTDISAQSAARMTEAINEAPFLKETFFGDGANILYKEILPSQGAVALVRPSAPYSDESVLVVAADRDTFGQPKLPTCSIYDFAPDVQEAYWRHSVNLLAAMQELTDEQGEQDRYRVLATENAVLAVTSPDRRTSRSVTLPHLQVFRFDREQVYQDEDQEPIGHLRHEQKLMDYLRRRLSAGNEFIAQVSERMSAIDEQSKVDQMALRNGPPFGYEFTFPDQVTAQEIAQTMAAHHEAYAVTASSIITRLHEANQARVIGQPSYRLYLYWNDEGRLATIISPEVLSHAGTIEAAGAVLDRSEHYPQLHSAQAIAMFQDSAVERAVAQQQTTVVAA